MGFGEVLALEVGYGCRPSWDRTGALGWSHQWVQSPGENKVSERGRCWVRVILAPGLFCLICDLLAWLGLVHP